MPRKKTAKRSSKRAATPNSALANTQKLEKEFIGVPAKLAAQLTKEINALKQKESKLKNALKKVKVQAKSWEGKIRLASKTKNATSGKKQLNTAKKGHASTVKASLGLHSELDETTALLTLITHSQNKFNMLGKLLYQFEKEWAKSAKQAVGTKAKPKTRKKARKIKPDATPSHQLEKNPVETEQLDTLFEVAESTH